jgi:hypothetical protein
MVTIGKISLLVIKIMPTRSMLLASVLLIIGLVTAKGEAMALTLRYLDISAEKERQSVVAAGTPTVYQGHPTTTLLPDGKTILCVWTNGHGGSCGPMAKSTDGGQSWTPVNTPADWTTMWNCPSIYLLTGPDGVRRVMVFAARPQMAQTISSDDGITWTPVHSLGKPCVMAFSSIIRLKNGDYLGLYHRGEGDKDRPPLSIWQSISHDGGLTWGESTMVGAKEGCSPCEPAVLRSPDGKQLLCLMRENQRTKYSLMMTSNDEGVTWTAPVYTASGLTGDRHVARYAPDGRLVVTFRDMSPDSPTKGHFCAWVGTYDDIINGRAGQYHVKLLHSYAGGDCGYPGLVLLPDGTFVATTYIKYAPGENKQSVVSTRFTLADFDALAAKLPSN